MKLCKSEVLSQREEWGEEDEGEGKGIALQAHNRRDEGCEQLQMFASSCFSAGGWLQQASQVRGFLTLLFL